MRPLRGDLQASVCAEVERLMLARGWSQVRFARELGVSGPLVNQKLRGRVRLDFEDLEAMCEALGVTPGDVLRQVTGGYLGSVAA